MPGIMGIKITPVKNFNSEITDRRGEVKIYVIAGFGTSF